MLPTDEIVQPAHTKFCFDVVFKVDPSDDMNIRPRQRRIFLQVQFFLMQHYASIWKAIIRPPRDVYSIKDLGPNEFHIGRMKVSRTDMEIKNQRGLRIQCSHFEPVSEARVAEVLPCVIYLHGNSSSRVEALQCIPVLLRLNITLFCFDCAGSGLSEGEYVSLGYYERDDLAAVISHLRQLGTVGPIGLWGRSMGAATCLLHAHRDQSIAGMVLDSPFTSLRQLAEELVGLFIGVHLPKWIVSMALNMIRSTIKNKALFDINELSPIKHVGNSYIPAMFVAAKGDDFIKPHHARALSDAYGGDKNLVLVDGDHNSARPRFFLDSVAIFFYNTLQCDQLPHPIETAEASRAEHHIAARRRTSLGTSKSPEIEANAASNENNIDGSPEQRIPFTMRPPDRTTEDFFWNNDEDVMMQKAIENSLKHVEEEGTPLPTGDPNNPTQITKDNFI